MEYANEKKSAALLSIFSNSFLIITKLFVGISSGSVSIISEAVHSFTDLLASILAFFSVKISSEPADNDHQFGHGKFEDLSGVIEGLLIIVAAIYIIYEAAQKLINHSFHHLETTSGIIVMILSVIINIFVSVNLFRVARKTDSIALLADAEHLKADIYTSLGVLLGLVIIKFTGLSIVDPIIALFIAIFIIKTGVSLCLTSSKNLLDVSLPAEDKKLIVNTVKNYISDEIQGIKNIKTRKAGPNKLVEFTIIVPTDMTIKEGHDICDKIEHDLSSKINNLHVTIHIEPCNTVCSKCILYSNDSVSCSRTKTE